MSVDGTPPHLALFLLSPSFFLIFAMLTLKTETTKPCVENILPFAQQNTLIFAKQNTLTFAKQNTLTFVKQNRTCRRQ